MDETSADWIANRWTIFSIGLSHLQTHEVPSLEVTSGTGVEVSGVLLDGEYRPIPDAALEIWQSDAQGDYAAMQGEGGRCTDFARVAVDYEGRFHFATEIPGRVA